MLTQFKLKRLWFCVILMTSIASFSFAATTAVKQPTLDFTGVAKEAIPAVVSIKVKHAKNSISRQWDYEDNNDSFFGDDFLQRFFGYQRRSPDTEPSIGQASGFIVSPDGLIITNNHVVKDTSEIIVLTNSGDEYTAKILGQDDNTDIALLKIDAKNLPHLKLGNSDALEVGQWVVAIGNPMGLQASLTAGVVSAKGRNNLDLTRIEDFIQTDAAINRGNSGGPLLNMDGEVIGMNTAIVSNMSTGGYMGIGFAIPSNLIKHVEEELLSNGSMTRGFLGVSLQQVDNGLAQAFGLKKAEGALIAEITRGSPAEKSGIRQGDVILKYNNHEVTSIAGLRNAISLMKPGTKINLTILRDGKAKEIVAEVGSFPKEPTLALAGKGAENKFGFEVQNLTPEISKNLGYQEESGVVISKVDPDSPAAWAGLKKGILIVAANQKKISNVDEFSQALEATEKGKPLLLLIKQGNIVRYLSLQIN